MPAAEERAAQTLPGLRSPNFLGFGLGLRKEEDAYFITKRTQQTSLNFLTETNRNSRHVYPPAASTLKIGDCRKQRLLFLQPDKNHLKQFQSKLFPACIPGLPDTRGHNDPTLSSLYIPLISCKTVHYWTVCTLTETGNTAGVLSAYASAYYYSCSLF